MPDVPATRLVTPPPEYPADLRGKEITGMVLIVATVDESGAVKEATVAKSSHSALNRCAVQAVRKWKFKPAEKDGRPVMTRVSIPLQFQME